MNLRIAIFVILAATALMHNPSPSFAFQGRGTRWQKIRYSIVANLDTTSKRLTANMTIDYVNTSPDTLRAIYLQVPTNAFHNEENTAAKEMRRFNNGAIDFGYKPGRELTIQSLQFYAIGQQTEFPLQAYDFSDTVLRLSLPYGLSPGDSLKLGTAFFQDFSNRVKHRKSKIPRDFFLWFPRLAVYDSSGWNAEPFHFMMQPGDVYSGFADMDVTLTVPSDFVVAASGKLVGGDPGWQAVTMDTAATEERDPALAGGGAQMDEHSRRKVRFQARHVRDFIWSASRDLVYNKAEIDGKTVHLLLHHGHAQEELAELLPRIHLAIGQFEEYFGTGLVTEVTLLTHSDRPYTVPGMSLLEDGSYFDLGSEFSEFAIPGKVGVNGFKEPWISGGLKVFLGKSLSEKAYGRRGYDMNEAQEDMNWLERQYPLPTLDALLKNLSHLYSASGQNEPIANEINGYHDPIGAVFNVYLKADLFYEMLRYVIGDAAFKNALHHLVRDNAFTHINEHDLREVFEAESGQKLDWFFDQWLRATPSVDYKKGRVRQQKQADDSWVTEVEVVRKGDGIMPVEVELQTHDGRVLVKRWEGKKKSGTVFFRTDQKPGAVRVDPDDQVLDSNRLNNARPRLEVRPDFPLLRYIHMPGDAFLVLWRPVLGHTGHDGLRLGFGAESSYRAFYHRVAASFAVGLASQEVDGSLAYSNPISRTNLLNRYRLMLRKNEGRFEADLHLEFNGSSGILAAQTGRRLRVGLNYTDLLNGAYTFQEVRNDTGVVRFDEWDNVNVWLSYVDSKTRWRVGPFDTEARFRTEVALPGGDVQFGKLSGRLQAVANLAGLQGTIRGNLATSFGPDDLPLQDQFRADGASARTRFQNDILKTGDAVLAFSRRFVEGGGFLHGYVGQPLFAEKYATLNLEFATSRNLTIVKPFAFFDTGKIWLADRGQSVRRSDAGVGLTFFGNQLPLFGGNLALFENLSAKQVFPLWLSNPLPGERQAQFRWYFTLGKAL